MAYKFIEENIELPEDKIDIKDAEWDSKYEEMMKESFKKKLSKEFHKDFQVFLGSPG